jgi:hypothetical protein
MVNMTLNIFSFLWTNNNIYHSTYFKILVKKLGAWLLEFHKIKKSRQQDRDVTLQNKNLPDSISEETMVVNSSNQTIEIQTGVQMNQQVESFLNINNVSNYNVSNNISPLRIERNYNYPINTTSNNDIEMMEKIFKNYPDKFWDW